MSLNPIRHILINVKTEPFFSVREHPNHDSLTLTRSIVLQYCELESLVSVKRTPSCKYSRRIAMLRHDQALKEGLDEVAKAGFRTGT